MLLLLVVLLVLLVLVFVLVLVLVVVLVLLLVLMLALMLLLMVLVVLVECWRCWCWCCCWCHCCYRYGSFSTGMRFFFSRKKGSPQGRVFPSVTRKTKLAKRTGDLSPFVPRAVPCCVALGGRRTTRGSLLPMDQSKRLLSYPRGNCSCCRGPRLD